MRILHEFYWLVVEVVSMGDTVVLSHSILYDIVKKNENIDLNLCASLALNALRHDPTLISCTRFFCLAFN